MEAEQWTQPLLWGAGHALKVFAGMKEWRPETGLNRIDSKVLFCISDLADAWLSGAIARAAW
jgi:hypothetical protein